MGKPRGESKRSVYREADRIAHAEQNQARPRRVWISHATYERSKKIIRIAYTVVRGVFDPIKNSILLLLLFLYTRNPQKLD
jgi:hypothetical protein